jgi:hypothetical protein
VQKKRARSKHSTTEIIVWIISMLVILSMAIGFVISVLPAPEPPTPTPIYIQVTSQPASPALATPGIPGAPTAQ